jgi:hypothetical protein
MRELIRPRVSYSLEHSRRGGITRTYLGFAGRATFRTRLHSWFPLPQSHAAAVSDSRTPAGPEEQGKANQEQSQPRLRI